MHLFNVKYSSNVLILSFNFSIFGFAGNQIGKLPLDDIKKELKAVGVSTEAVEQILQVLSIKSLTTLEGC